MSHFEQESSGEPPEGAGEYGGEPGTEGESGGAVQDEDIKDQGTSETGSTPDDDSLGGETGEGAPGDSHG